MRAIQGDACIRTSVPLGQLLLAEPRSHPVSRSPLSSPHSCSLGESQHPNPGVGIVGGLVPNPVAGQHPPTVHSLTSTLFFPALPSPPPLCTSQAFSHFTFERSGHQLIVVDIQGVGDLYTDPQIHTETGTDFGDGNLGGWGNHPVCMKTEVLPALYPFPHFLPPKSQGSLDTKATAEVTPR